MTQYIRYLVGVVLCIFFVLRLDAQQVNYAEYFFDNDPGKGNGIALTVSPSNTIDATYSISTTSLSSGMHVLYIRTRSNTGKWSLNSKRMFYVNPSYNTALNKIVAAEYFINSDPGLGNGMALSITAGDTISTTKLVPTSTLPSGIHVLFVRVKNGYGKWSLSKKQLVFVSYNQTIKQLVAAEYFVDQDPGCGNASPLAVTTGNTIDLTTAISTASLNSGLHVLNARVKNSDNKWSLCARQLLYVSKPLAFYNIVKAEYFFDADPGFGNANAITFTSDDSINLVTAINANGLSSGIHYFSIRFKDANGKWSLVDRKLMYIMAGQNSNPNIVAAEYFFDMDPGFGNGNSISLTAGSFVDITSAIASNSLSIGHHSLNVRVKDSLGRWSLIDQKLVFVSPALANQKITAIEYSVDTIMPFGQGTMVNIAPSDTIDFTFSFNHGLIDTFFHKMYLRVKDAGGRWSFLDSMHFRLESCIIPTAIFNYSNFCLGDSLVLSNSSLFTDTFSLYDWDLGMDGNIESNDSDYYVFKPSVSGNYKVRLTVTNYVCIDTTIANIQVYPKPDNSISLFGNINFCPGSFSVLAANAGVGYQYQWLKNGGLVANANSSFYQANDSGDYQAVVKNIYDCVDTTSTISLGVYNLPQATINLSGNSSICNGDSVQLISPLQAGIDYQWYFNGDTIQNAILNTYWAKNTGDYKVKITNSNGCSDISNPQSILVNPVPVATIQAGGNPVFCSGQNVVLYGSNGVGYSYQWLKDGAEINGATSPFFVATQSGNYTVKIGNAYNCVDTSTAFSVITNPSPTISVLVSGANTVCQGDTVLLHGPNDPTLSFQWNSYGTPISGATDSVLTVLQTGNYTLVATNSYNCSTTSLGNNVTVNPNPGASILPLGSTSFCFGDSVVLQANSGTGLSYYWFKNGDSIGLNNNLFIADSSGNYTVKVYNSYNCFTESQAISITSFPIPNAIFNMPLIICAHDTVQISYTGTGSSSGFYNWNFGGSTIISGNGQGPYHVVWSQPGLKTVSLAVSENGCISSTQVQNAQLLSVPSFITAPITSVCQGDSVQLTANSGSNLNYQWYQGGLLLPSDTLATFVTTNSGAFQVKVIDNQNGCFNLSSSIPVTINSNDFSLAFSSSATNFSQPPFNVSITNQTPNLNNFNFLWELGDGNTSTFFNPVHGYQYNGLYTVSLFAENASTGCRDTLIKTDYISCSGGAPNPCNILAAITPPGPATICSGDSVVLSASAGTGYSYQWVFNNMIIPNAQNQFFTAKQGGNYRVIISDAVCSQTSPAFVLNHYPSIQPVIQATGQLQPCTIDSMLLSLFVNYNSYNWSTGATSSSIYVSNTGYYQVAVTDNYGCNLTSQPFAVNNSFLNPPEICIVGVDSNNNNRLVWERQSNALIDSFYIYREGFMANSYNKIGAIPFTQTSLFVDVNSNPAVQSYRYKIAAVDTCGGVTLLSNYHKTIHLTINAGLNGSWNLIWDGYQGFNFSTYRIYRGTSTANMVLLTQLPSSSTSYTDLNPPSGTVYYQIEVIKSSGCYPDTVVSKANTNYNTSRSNTANNGSISPIFLTADFTANTQTGQWPIQVQFSDQSTGSPNAWDWDFGDGNTSIVQNPKHSFNNTGLYTVKLKVCNGNTCDTTTKVDYINVLPNGLVEVGVVFSAKLYPNPNDGNFTLEIHDKSTHQLQIHVYNSTGSEVYFENFESKGQTFKQLQLSVLSKGIYHLIINSNDGIIYKEKLVIQ
jgi:PKD repeat protein